MSIFFFSFDSSCTASATDEVVSSVIMSTTLGIIPAPGNRGREIGLVLVVRSDDLDLLAEHLAAEILDRHPGGLQRIFAARVGIDARLIVQDTDLDLCRSGRHEKHCANSHGRQQS